MSPTKTWLLWSNSNFILKFRGNGSEDENYLHFLVPSFLQEKFFYLTMPHLRFVNTFFALSLGPLTMSNQSPQLSVTHATHTTKCDSMRLDIAHITHQTVLYHLSCSILATHEGRMSTWGLLFCSPWPLSVEQKKNSLAEKFHSCNLARPFFCRWWFMRRKCGNVR